MTRTFNEKIRCEKCGHEHTNETDFERWMRGNADLDSRNAGIVRFDLDMLLHKYMMADDDRGNRDLQCMMAIEIKTRMAEITPAQSDTINVLNQILRNRRPNIHSKPPRQIEGQLTEVWSEIARSNVRIKLFGAHILRMDGTSPINSTVMLWDKKPISCEQLIKLLLFKIDPDRIGRREREDRRRTGANAKPAPLLPTFIRRSDFKKLPIDEMLERSSQDYIIDR